MRDKTNHKHIHNCSLSIFYDRSSEYKSRFPQVVTQLICRMRLSLTGARFDGMRFENFTSVHARVLDDINKKSCTEIHAHSEKRPVSKWVRVWNDISF